jgi:hypothetical protein
MQVSTPYPCKRCKLKYPTLQNIQQFRWYVFYLVNDKYRATTNMISQSIWDTITVSVSNLRAKAKKNLTGSSMSNITKGGLDGLISFKSQMDGAHRLCPSPFLCRMSPAALLLVWDWPYIWTNQENWFHWILHVHIVHFLTKRKQNPWNKVNRALHMHYCSLEWTKIGREKKHNWGINISPFPLAIGRTHSSISWETYRINCKHKFGYKLIEFQFIEL